VSKKYSNKGISRILLSRTDAIGDVILTLPMAGIIKKYLPECKIIFLGKSYTKPVIALSEHVDEFINYDEMSQNAGAESWLKKINADAIIHVFPRKEIAYAARKAGIPMRIGTSHRIYHLITCNKLIALGRKNSELHEAQLNLKLLEPFGITDLPHLNEIHEYFGFSKIPLLPDSLKKLIDADKFNLIFHPSSNASAREWPLENYFQLIHLLDRKKFKIFITGQTQENILYNQWRKSLPDFVTDCTGLMTLPELISYIHACDGLIACSTGPLHIAAALNKKVIGLYPPIRPMHTGRWGGLGDQVKNISLNKSCVDCKNNPVQCHCMNEIQVDEIKQEIEKWTS
jgi:heptosyltransferase-3